MSHHVARISVCFQVSKTLPAAPRDMQSIMRRAGLLCKPTPNRSFVRVTLLVSRHALIKFGHRVVRRVFRAELG
jgi:hypothetical protein